jgi:hypothetical protein
MRRIGILMPFPPTNAEMQARVRAFREELRKRGWAAGINAQFDERWTSDNMDLIRSAAANLVELNPDVILAAGARVVPILMELTRSIPIVTPSSSDAIERGYAGSVARPGSNVTGSPFSSRRADSDSASRGFQLPAGYDRNVDDHHLAARNRGHGQRRAAAAVAAAATAEGRRGMSERLSILRRLLCAGAEHQVPDDAEARRHLPCGLHRLV